ncbi:hypothetical protein BDR07DRAFT_393055 [Suillus spraguei]|nr:hypothetical protein BDR07DRAFT_393055 [Suillus spraguei]
MARIQPDDHLMRGLCNEGYLIDNIIVFNKLVVPGQVRQLVLSCKPGEINAALILSVPFVSANIVRKF